MAGGCAGFAARAGKRIGGVSPGVRFAPPGQPTRTLRPGLMTPRVADQSLAGKRRQIHHALAAGRTANFRYGMLCLGYSY